MLRRILSSLFLFFGASVALWAAASLTLYPVRLDLTPSRTDAVLRITNNNAEPVVLQARVYRWKFNEQGDVLVPTDEVIVNPPMATLPSKGEQVLRVGLRHASEDSAEISYRLIVEEVLPKNAVSTGGLNTRLRLSLPIFVAPHGKVQPNLQWSVHHDDRGELMIEAANRGAAHIRIEDLRVFPNNDAAKAIDFNVPEYLLPGQRKEWDLGKAGQVDPADLTVEAHTDAGKLQQRLRTSGN